MAGYNESIGRGGSNGPALIPTPLATEIIKQLPQQSAILSRARRVPMSTKTLRQPVLSALPNAYWVNGDTGMKQTTKADWDSIVMTAEELAALVVIPDALFDDAQVPLWDQVQPYLVEAIGKAVDEAALFGVSKPASWPTAIIPAAIAAGNSLAEVGTEDLAVTIAKLGEKLGNEGYDLDGFASRPGLSWKLLQLRSTTGEPIYGAPLQEGQPASLYGYGLNSLKNGAWDPSVATLVGADWSKFVVGVRQDITFNISDEAVITDDTGKVILNAYQQDSKILRVVFRVGFQTANPVNRIQPDGTKRYPAAVLTPKVG